MHHYAFHPGDYMLDTAHLEPMEDLCYRRLLDFYYVSESAIPKETDQVSRRIRLDEVLVSKVLNEFFQLTENGWQHVRCDKEIATYQSKVNRAKVNGSQGGRPKKTDQVISRNRKESGSKANQEPITNNHEPKKEESLPLPFASVEFKTSWEKWTKYRNEIKKPLTPTMIESQLSQLEKMGEARSIAMIEHTIGKGWQGLFEPDQGLFGVAVAKKSKHQSCL